MKSKDLATPWLSKKFQAHPPNPAEAEPSFRKFSLPPAKLRMILPTHIQVSKILTSMKISGAQNAEMSTKSPVAKSPAMQSGMMLVCFVTQLSRVPWPGSSWMHFSSPTNIHTELAHHTFNRLHQLFPRGVLRSTTQPHQSAARQLERAASHIKVAHPPCLFRLPPQEYVNRSTTLFTVCE